MRILQTDRSAGAPPQLAKGELVTVRSADEILATLDDRAAVDGLPFMPEMLQFCGRTFRVSNRADKTCDVVEWSGVRRMHGTVHLEGLRCDGSGHGGCQASCLLFWKEEWLARSLPSSTSAITDSRQEPDVASPGSGADLVAKATRRPKISGEGERFSCQATQVREATTPLAWWDARQYARDLRTGNAGPIKLLRGLTVLLFNKYQGFSKRYWPERMRIQNGRRYPFFYGSLENTPSAVLNLQPGELVEVKSREEILETIDNKALNRGLSFDVEMLKYCGRRARVLRRVEQIIDERTGKMVNFHRDCIVLEGITCKADYNQFCPKNTYPYFREIWLKRVG